MSAIVTYTTAGPQVSLNGMCADSMPHNQTRVMVGMSGIMSLWHYIAVV